MKKLLNTFFIATIAVSFNVDAATLTPLIGDLGTTYQTALVFDTPYYELQKDDNLDPIIAYTYLSNSGDATEIDWMTAVLDEYLGEGTYDPITGIEKIEFVEDGGIFDPAVFWVPRLDVEGNPVLDSQVGAIYDGPIDGGTTFYLAKIGEGQLEYDTFFYENLDSLFLASIGLGWLDYFSEFSGNNFNIYRISHLSLVPVPAAFWLFGTALIGFVGFSRRRTV